MSFKDDIKAMIIGAGWTIKRVNDELNRRHDTTRTLQGLSAKIQRETLTYKEVLEIADILGYQILWRKNVSIGVVVSPEAKQLGEGWLEKK